MKAVLFDLFGTLVPNLAPEVWSRSCEEIAAILGIDASDYGRLWSERFEERMTGRIPDGPGQFVALGTTPVEDIEKRLNVTFSAPDVDTLSGLLMHYSEDIVEEGQSVELGRVLASVLDASNGRAVRVRLTLPETADGD